MQVCTSLQTDNHASTSPLSFLQVGCPSCRPTNSVKALKAIVYDTYRTIEVSRSRHGWVLMFITHRPSVTLQLHDFDLFRTCRTSSFCTVAWQLARFQLTGCIAWSLGDSWASCLQPLQMHTLWLFIATVGCMSVYFTHGPFTDTESGASEQREQGQRLLPQLLRLGSSAESSPGSL